MFCGGAVPAAQSEHHGRYSQEEYRCGFRVRIPETADEQYDLRGFLDAHPGCRMRAVYCGVFCVGAVPAAQ